MTGEYYSKYPKAISLSGHRYVSVDQHSRNKAMHKSVSGGGVVQAYLHHVDPDLR